MNFRLYALMVCAVLGLGSQSVHAVDTTTEAERRYLIQVVKDLNAIEVLVEKAESQADDNARLVFYYDGLKSDLTEIRRALVQHLESPSRTPRRVTPLKTRAKH